MSPSPAAPPVKAASRVFASRLWARLADRVDAWTAAPTPPLAVEIAAGRVAVGRAGADTQFWSRPLPPGAVEPSAVRANVVHREAVVASLRSALSAQGGEHGGGELATLLVPDLTARISILDFDALPARRDELAPLARFRLRKSLPFSEEQSVISCQALSPTRMLVAVADRARVDEYEDCLEAAGAHAAIVLPSGLAALAAEPALGEGAMLIRAEEGSLTTAFCRQERVEFFRVVELTGPATLEDVFPSIAFFRDHTEAGSSTDAAGSAPELRPGLVAAGLSAELEAQLREEFPGLPLRAVSSPPDLAVGGALRGRFS